MGFHPKISIAIEMVLALQRPDGFMRPPLPPSPRCREQTSIHSPHLSVCCSKHSQLSPPWGVRAVAARLSAARRRSSKMSRSDADDLDGLIVGVAVLQADVLVGVAEHDAAATTGRLPHLQR